MKKKNQSDLTYMSLGLARQYDIKNKIDKVIPVDDPKNRVFNVMVSEGICGISTLASLGDSTTEWNQHIIAMLDTIPMLVRIENPMVIIGQSGTGKESMAKVVHRIANGDDKPFISVNCSAIPKDMLESELFGHEKGAFTGATEPRKGMIESAKEGSIFLDELGKMDMNLQFKLLRVIEDHKIRRLGSNKDIRIDNVKFIIALQPQDIDRKTEHIAVDLLNRLNLYSAIELPPLKKRLRADPNIIHDVLEKLQKNVYLMSDDEKKEVETLAEKVKEVSEKYEKSLKKTDIPKFDNTILPDQIMETIESENFLTEHIKCEAELSILQSTVRLSPEAEVAIVNYGGYDGKNFRELENILKKALINAYIARRKKILPDDLPEEVRNPSAPEVASKRESAKDVVVDETENVALKDIINHANKMKKTIVRKKIGNILNKGGNLKVTLQSEGALKEKGDYIKFYKKVETILGKGFIKNIHHQSTQNH